MRRWLILGLLLAGCSDKSPLGPQDVQTGDTVLDAVAEGMDLPGDAEAPALSSIVTLAPTPVPEAQIQGSLLTTRLRAVLNPAATVGQVNEALSRHGAKIVSMVRGTTMVVLVIDPVADLAEAEERAGALAEEPAFLAVFPARAFQAPSEGARSTAWNALRELPEGAEGTPDPHLVHLRMPAAWNVRTRVGAPVKVLVADHFPDRSGDSRIDALTFSAYGGFGTDSYGRNGNILGNDGPFSSGIIGADWTSAVPGIHPGAGLRIVGIPVGGLDLWEVSSAIYDELTLGGDRFVLLTGLTYREADAEDLAALEMATLALNWRLLLRNQARDFEPLVLHIVPGGDQSPFDDAPPIGTDGSYWAVSANYGNLHEYLESLGGTEQEVEQFDQLARAAGAAVASQTYNLLVVGASDANGARLSTSADLTDVRVHGELVFGPCRLAEQGAPGASCSGQIAAYTGTFAAAPQVAGLGAYLWSLAPRISSSDIRVTILDSYEGGFVDGYRATLALDPGLFDPRIRDTLLDPDDDGEFGESDVLDFLTSFSAYEELRDGSLVADFSRYDLNGDGITGGFTRAPFDLDADGTLGTVTDESDATYEEGAVTDREVLCYYAHSELYFGSEELDQLRAACQGQLDIQVLAWSEEITSTGQDLELVVRSKSDGTPAPDVEISLTVTGGAATPSTATTDDEGHASSRITPSPGATRVEVRIDAEDDRGQRGSTTVSATNTAELPIQITQHYGRAWLGASSTDPNNRDHSLYTQSSPDRVDPSWFVQWNRETTGEANGSTCGVNSIVEASSSLDFDPSIGFSGFTCSGRIEASALQVTADPTQSVVCRGQGQIQLQYRFVIHEGSWRAILTGDMGAEEPVESNWNAAVVYQNLQGQFVTTTDVADLSSEQVLGPGEYALFLNPNGVGNTDVVQGAGFAGSCWFNLSMRLERVR